MSLVHDDGEVASFHLVNLVIDDRKLLKGRHYDACTLIDGLLEVL